MVEVRLFATLRDGREKAYSLPREVCGTVGDIIAHLEIPPGDVTIMLVNGRHQKPETAVSDGDLVALFPPVGGG
ncbi:MAG: MoaD/ThiS family protein [Oscillospiraceae bacterium]|jgi:molybdopterin converting factor small subunit|nr:MoaD/ThiS family protein [Oscillospiraceae bacterium]